MAEAQRSFTLIDVACAVLELDERLTDDGVPYEVRALRLARAREVVFSWTAGTTTTERAELELLGLLPDSRERPPSQGPASSREVPSVLLVDDEPMVARAHARWLRRAGVDVVTCTSPAFALDRLSAGERFDVVICDCRMPGLGGVEFFERARSVWPALPERFLFFSGGMSDADALFLRARGLPLLPKPLPQHGAELSEIVRGVVACVGLAPREDTLAPPNAP